MSLSQYLGQRLSVAQRQNKLLQEVLEHEDQTIKEVAAEAQEACS